MAFKKGNIPWNKGLKGFNSNFPRSENWCKNISKSKLGKHFSLDTEFKKGHKINLGKKHSEFSKINYSKSKLGEKNPSWKGGIAFEPYDKSFNNKFKRAIRKRDNQICLKCGIHREKLNRALDVHHIDYNKKLSIPQNCCAICNRCNVEVNTNREHWTKFFQSLLSEKYGYQYSENEEIILNLNNGGKDV